MRHKLKVLARLCAAIGHDPAEIETTLSSRLAPTETAGQLAARARIAAGSGIDYLMLVIGTVDTGNHRHRRYGERAGR